MASSNPEARETHFRRHWWGYGMAMLIVYALSGPLLRFAYPTDLLTLGMLSGGLIFTGHWSSIYSGDWDAKAMFIIAAGCLMLAAVVAIPVIDHARADSHANDRRCLAIQRDMLSARPRRSDGPDLFQALGCRPQGEGSVYAPAKSRNDIKI